MLPADGAIETTIWRWASSSVTTSGVLRIEYGAAVATRGAGGCRLRGSAASASLAEAPLASVGAEAGALGTASTQRAAASVSAFIDIYSGRAKL
jgi:hypothetical protein